MPDLTPEKLAELRRLLDAPPQHITIVRDDALALLDAAEERDEIAGRLAHLLCDLTGGRMSKTSYPVPVMAQEIEQYLSECHESDLKDERDALAAKLDAVRALHGPRVVQVLGATCSAEECDHEDACPLVDYAVCGHCYDVGDGAHPYAYEDGGLQDVAYPCPTIRALAAETGGDRAMRFSPPQAPRGHMVGGLITDGHAGQRLALDAETGGES